MKGLPSFFNVLSFSFALRTADVMALESDVTLEGYNTPNETEKPIMAHPPVIYSDNTLQDWLTTVLRLSDKGITLQLKKRHPLK